MTVAPKLETVIWHGGTDDITPLTVLHGVALTPPAGAFISLDGVRYRVTGAPEINHLTEDAPVRDEEVSVLLTVVLAGSPEGF